MRRLALGADERPQAAFVRREDGVVGWLADDDQVGPGLLLREHPRAAAIDLLIGDKHHDQRAPPKVSLRGEETTGLGHGHNRALGVAGSAPEQLAVALDQTKRIACPTAANRNGVDVRVERETGAVAIVNPADDIRAAIRDKMNFRSEADGLEVGREERSGLLLPSGRVLSVDGDKLLEQAGEARHVRGRSLYRAHCTFPLAATS